jgi:hypothetical protein
MRTSTGAKQYVILFFGMVIAMNSEALAGETRRAKMSHLG